ncbi:uncharacterized protein MONBRDRAFT_32412 [Monosiga brevicollis MX1]|uniref:Anaphase-promoting complex subunit 6 n=1 Tax=Monosiga brevicollis TaxID=81824 RepID=A9UZD0_MONBE|nr:uncharacterized protein MONBRDRAFT_32412 [Monosiga brevicollis MX1]EDQ89210.1 predicted protein [Monosiga brevicollis MX1]|eukprot:XP_001745786.1 hypothetical protein [Monosiga brevicollis MX1]
MLIQLCPSTNRCFAGSEVLVRAAFAFGATGANSWGTVEARGLCRALAAQAAAAYQNETAIFWFNKAISLSSGAVKDVYALGQQLRQNREPKRAIALLHRFKLVVPNVACRHLAALCHFDLEEYRDALDTIGNTEAAFAQLLSNVQVDDTFAPIANISVSLALLRARIHEQLDNLQLATESYLCALKHDMTCMEALNRLTNHYMLTLSQEKKLLAQAVQYARETDTPAAQLILTFYKHKLNRAAAQDRKDKSISFPELLQNNQDVRIERAKDLFRACRFHECYEETTAILDEDPYAVGCLPTHIACLVELNDTSGLFYLAHQLVDSSPKDAARRYYGKATKLQNNCGDAWIGFGHSFALEGEHDQAMAAYSTAARIMPGSHLPLMYIGMEYSATDHHELAKSYFERAMTRYGTGILNLKLGFFDVAVENLRNALDLASAQNSMTTRHRVASFNALGRAYHSSQWYEEAIGFYEQALALDGRNGEAHAGIGACYHEQDDLGAAIESYHQALAVQPANVFAQVLLDHALLEEADQHLRDIDDCLLDQFATNSLSGIAGFDESDPLISHRSTGQPPLQAHHREPQIEPPENERFPPPSRLPSNNLRLSPIPQDSDTSALDESAMDMSDA